LKNLAATLIRSTNNSNLVAATLNLCPHFIIDPAIAVARTMPLATTAPSHLAPIIGHLNIQQAAPRAATPHN